MSKVLEFHEHICDNCVTSWKHADETCDRNYKKILTCNTCTPVSKEWAEMAQNMPIPHSHRCVVCERIWEHNDKKCAIEERYWLECEACMTFTFTHPCLKCGTESEEVVYGPYNVTRCVCPKCRHYFAPPRQEGYAAEVHLCPGCGKQAKKGESAPGCVCYTCSDCEYSFYGEGQDTSAMQGVVQPNSICPRCSKGFFMKEDGLGICPECEYWFRLHNPGHGHKTEEEDVCPRCGTHVISDMCSECGYNILLDDGSEYDNPTGVG